MSRPRRFINALAVAALLSTPLSLFADAGDRRGILKEPVKFDIVIHGSLAGSITAAKGTRVAIVDEKDDRVLVEMNDSKAWIDKASLEMPVALQSTPSPTATPVPAPAAAPSIRAASSPTPPFSPDANIVSFKSGQADHWVTLDKNGRLLYAADAQGNRIPDFSNCGYEGGGVPLPVVPVKVTVDPVKGDAGAAIQAAVDQVSKLPLDSNGFRGAVLLHRGTYPVEGEIHIDADGVVLRGEGQDPNGTKLIATGKKKRSLIVVGSRGKKVKIKEDDEDSGDVLPVGTKARVAISDSYVPVGAHSFHVADASGFHLGDQVGVFRPSTENWIQFLAMDKIPQNKNNSVVQWAPGSKDLCFKRRITAIEGNMVTVDAPVCCALDKTYGGGQLILGTGEKTVHHVGFENFSGDSEFEGETDESHGWVFIAMVACRDGWVRDVTSIHFGYSCVQIDSDSSAITVQDSTCLDPVSKIIPGRRYSFPLDGQLCLVLRCHARNGRHDFVMHSKAPGPNSFVNCTAERAHSDSGPHQRWSVGVLYDNVTVHNDNSGGESAAGQINIRNRGGMGTGHGWAGANQVVWNCEADAITVEQPPTAQNWCIGSRAKTYAGNGYYENRGAFPQIPSLYRAQLTERLGKEVADSILGPEKH